MLRSSSLLRNLLYVLGGVAAIILGNIWLHELAKLDPFAAQRELDKQPLGKQVAIRLGNVEMRQYEAGKLTATCKIGQIDIADNRQQLSFLGVTEGKYYAKKGSFAFETDKVNWNAAARKVVFEGRARVKNKDVDLAAKNFTYDQKLEKLNIPGQVTGGFFNGKLRANGLVYDIGKDSYQVGPSEWVGALKNPLQETQRSRWKIRFGGISKRQNGKETGDNFYATDDEIIVKAEKGERDMKTDVVTATGNVQYNSAKADLVADKVVIDRRTKKAVLTGNVRMVVKPEDKEVLEAREVPPFQPIVPEQIAKNRPPAPIGFDETEVSSTKNIRKYPIAMTALKIEYWYAKGSRHAIITGEPQAQQELTAGRWRKVWAFRAEYDAEKEILKLLSGGEGKRDARMKNSRGEDLSAEWFEISTKEDDDYFSAFKMIGDVFTEGEEDDTINQGRLRKKKTPPPRGAPLKGQIGRGREI